MTDTRPAKLRTQTHGYDATAVDLGGMCVTSAAQTPPVLVAADVRLGKLRYGGRVYGFSTRALAAAFAADPDRRLEQVISASYATCAHFPRFSLHSVILSSFCDWNVWFSGSTKRCVRRQHLNLAHFLLRKKIFILIAKIIVF